MKFVSILGSTGSIGCNALKVIEFLEDFRVVGLAAGSNIDKLVEQVLKFKPEIVAVKDEECAEKLYIRLQELDADRFPKIRYGEEGLTEVAVFDKADILVSATVGATGFVPTLRAVEAGKRVALANKETLVVGGELIKRAAEKSRAEILPVDSEHNALHQCLRGERLCEVKRLILTASGGPFRSKSKQEIENATVEEALNHPNWRMGDKITIDSATLMNKGLEVIEAHWLFGFEWDRISVIVHPQSVVHSMVEMIDGSIIAQIGITDMKHAIQYALTYPERRVSCLEPLDFTKYRELTFEEPDYDRFPCLSLAYKALKIGGTMPAVLNASNEVAVDAFLSRKIKLSDIPKVIDSVMSQHSAQEVDDLETIKRVDHWARQKASAKIQEIYERIAAR